MNNVSSNDATASPHPVQVSVGILMHQGRVLIGRRPLGAVLAGYWEFPGGKVERDETPAAAVMRELSEELGIPVTVVRAISPVLPRSKEGGLALLPFLCRLRDAGDAERIQSRAHDELRWVHTDELGDYRFPTANAPLLDELRGVGVEDAVP